MMKLLKEGGQLSFKGTNCTLILPGGCTLYGKSVDDLLHISDFGRGRGGQHTAAVTMRSQAALDPVDEGNETGADGDEMELELTPNPEPAINVSSTTERTITMRKKPKRLSPNYLWHLRLAHASTSVISKISTIKSNFNSSSCLSCVRAKQHRLPFPKSMFKATKKVQYIHSDLSGPHILLIQEMR